MRDGQGGIKRGRELSTRGSHRGRGDRIDYPLLPASLTMFMLQTLTVLSLTVIFLASVEGRTQLSFEYLCVLRLACIACTLQVDRVANRAMANTKKGKKRERGMAAARM